MEAVPQALVCNRQQLDAPEEAEAMILAHLTTNPTEGSYSNMHIDYA